MLLKNLLLFFLAVIIVLEPFAITYVQTAKATVEADASDDDSDLATEEYIDPPPQDTAPKSVRQLEQSLYSNENSEDPSQIGFNDRLYGVQDARLIFNTTDFNAIRSLYCLNDLMPDFYTDFEAMYNYLPANYRPASVADLAKLKIENFDRFQDLYYQAQKAWGASTNAKNPRSILEQEVNQLGINSDTGVDPVMMDSVLGDNYKNIKCLTGLDTQQLVEIDKDYLMQLVDSALESTTIDIRVIKMLNYLVIPKNQGGAGHWRVRVKKILQDTARPYSNESETVRLSLGKQRQDTTAVNCAGMTAADCGVAQGADADSEQADANISAEDQNGDQYDVYLEGLDNAEERGVSTQLAPDRNISAHVKGQAVDIMELDDIRCTLKIVKKRRIGGNKTTKEKKVLRPIKLAWQTSQSYDQSGGNSVDMMGIMKQIANEEMIGLMDELNGDVTNYSGDLSDANFSDIVGIIGKTIFGQLLNSPNHNFAGFNTEDTLQKLGAMYFADYLGLPREIFMGRSITSLEDLEVIIGEAALEKRANLPYGSLESYNYKRSLEGTAVYDLEGTLINAGKRKLEYEMNLNPGDLKEYEEGLTIASLNEIIGNRVIEKGLNLPKDSFRGDDFRDLKKNLGDVRASVLFVDPTYIDNVLHITPGTAKQLTSGTISPSAFVELVGETRKNDTINGFKYLSANNAAYNLPDGAWNEALLGKVSGFVTIGRFTVSKVIQQNLTFSKYLYTKGSGHISEEEYTAMKDLNLTADPNDFGAAAAQTWLLENLGKTDKSSCQIPEKITQSISVKLTKPDKSEEIKDFNVDINEENAISLGLLSGDLSRMFGCASATPRSVFERVGSKLLYYGVANKLLDKEGKIKIDITDTNPELVSNDPEVNFYLNRIARVLELTKKVKSDWENEQDIDFGPAKEHLDAILSRFNNLNVTTISGAKEVAREIAFEVDGLLIDYENIRIKNQSKARKVDATIVNINQLIRDVSEIIAGKTIASADLLTIKQINASQTFASSWTSNDTNGTTGKQNNSSNTNSAGQKSTGFSPVALFDLITHRISATDFMVRIGAAQAENGLNLPPNSIYYLVQNYEKAGIRNIDAFYLAIGQAKIEQEFAMPSFYFQGDVINDRAPDFNNDFKAILQWAPSIVEFYRLQYASGGSATVQISKPEDYIKWTKANDRETFNSMVDYAKQAWFDDLQIQVKEKGGQLMNEKDLQDVSKNVTQRKYNDSIRAQGDDIMFRMGISGRLAALETGGFNAVTTAQAIRADHKLGLREGSTQALIKKQKVPLQDGSKLLGDGEKEQVAQGLYLTSELVDVLLRLINGEITLAQLGRQGLDPGYVDTNPYLKQYGDGPDDGSCPISYEGGDNKVTWEDFRNRTDIFKQTTFEGNTYCIVDKKGKHCFKNQSEAQTYAVNNSADQYDNVLWAVAQAIQSYAALTNSETLNSTEGIYQRLISFISGQTNSVFSEEEFAAINDGGITLAVTGSVSIDTELLRKLFSRVGDQTPLITYKRAAGHVEATKILNWRLFTSLGIDIPPGLFDSDDLYSLLNGDYKPLYRVGAYFIDKKMDFKPGTTQLIISALNPKNLKCALADAGAKMLGNAVGLNSVPIRGISPQALLRSIGQAKVEETLGLPRGIFKGTSMRELINNIKPMNFALIFKVPIYTERLENGETITTISRSDIAAILGENGANSLKSATGTYQLRSIVQYLSSAPALTQQASAAVANIDSKLPEYIETFLRAYGSGALPNDEAPANQKDYYQEIDQFKTLWKSLDYAFGIDIDTTAKLATGELTPDQFIEKIGSKMVVQIGAVELAEALGFSDTVAPVVASTALNFQKFFVCESNIGINNEACADTTYYHNWGMLYQNLSMIFKFNLDDIANLPAGTMARIFDDPSQAHWVLLDIAAKRLDEQFQLPNNNGFFDSPLLTFSELYRRVYSNVDGRADARANRDRQCTTDEERRAGIDPDQLRLRMKSNQRIIDEAERTGDTEAAARAEADNAAIKNQLESLNAAIQKCENDWRIEEDSEERYNFWQMASTTTAQLIRDGISESIHNRILEIEYDGERVGINMPVKDIERLVFYGDIRYLEIAGMALVVNIYQVKNTDEKHPVPANLRISYEDIKQAFFPDAASLQMARDAAVWGSLSSPEGEAYDRSRIYYGYGDMCPPGDFVSGLAHCTPENSPAPVRDEAGLVGAGGIAMAEGYGYDPATNFDSETLIKNTEDYLSDYESQRHSLLTSEECLTNQPSCQEKLKDLDDHIEGLTALHDAAVNATKEGERNLRKYNMERLEYRMMDQMLYGIDQNIFPGFAHALFKGSEKVKLAALERYILNGLKNGNLFGIKFDGVQNLVEWQGVLAFLSDFSQNGWSNGSAAFDSFVGSDGYRFFTNYLSEKSEDWLGVKLSPEMVGGIICGISTGQWGSFSPMADNAGNMYTNSRGVKIPTLGNAVTNWGMKRIFAWADKALGLPVGQSYEWFSVTKDIYNAQKALSNARSVYSSIQDLNAGKTLDAAALARLNNLSEAAKTEILKSVGIDPVKDGVTGKITNFPPKNLTQDQLKQINSKYVSPKELAMVQLQIALYTKIITFFMDKWLAGTYASIEDNLNLVPGSLAIVVDAAVGMAVTSYMIHNSAAAAAHSQFLTGAAQSAFWIGVAIFVLVNLFGVYKVEVDLICTADGYWPLFEPAPSSNVADVSSIGTWDGMNAAVMKQKTIESAQYKASRLIGDVLMMQENPAFKDIVPSQIMTGRQEDVDTWNNTVSDFMCKWVNNKAVGGICGGDTRAGLWANPQTIAWTHIGY